MHELASRRPANLPVCACCACKTWQQLLLQGQMRRVAPVRPAWHDLPQVVQAGRSVGELYAELAAAGLVLACPPVTLGSFLGESSCNTRGAREADMVAQPGLAEVRAAAALLCVLPLACAYAHER